MNEGTARTEGREGVAKEDSAMREPVATARLRALRAWLLWTAGFVCFPLGALAGAAVVGRVDTPAAALIGGLVTGAVIGTGQALLSSGRLDPRRWIPATAAGLGLGLLVGGVAVDFRTGIADLATLGALNGLVLGVAQALALPGRRRGGRRLVWAAALPVLWSLGWTVTTLAGIDVERQYTVFGSSGAITVSALTGIVLHHLSKGDRP